MSQQEKQKTADNPGVGVDAPVRSCRKCEECSDHDHYWVNDPDSGEWICKHCEIILETQNTSGSVFREIGSGITLGCISLEASDFLDRAMTEWHKHMKSIKETNPNWEESVYGFAYWLARWSGLITYKPRP